MPTRSFTIYEVANSYVSAGTSPTISATFTLQVSDDDGFLNATAADDSGASQTLTFDGGSGTVSSYEFFYNDTVTIAGGSETIKTFQLTIDGVTRSFVMNDTGGTIPGAGVGVPFTLDVYGNYTPIDYNDLPCFTRGTLIQTENGYKAVENLKAGDLIHTADHGLQPIRWIGSSVVTLRDLLALPHLRPVVIPADCFGPARPARDLKVSPQHRIVLTGWQVELQFGTNEAFAPAKSLIGRRGIHTDTDCREVEYYHFMLDQHEVVLSEGLATESFLVGETIRDNMDLAQLEEILELFPELADYDQSKAAIPARPVLKRFEVAALDQLVA